jgi:hypothetical protein
MFDRDQFLASVDREARICSHLHGKLDPAGANEAPGEGMRTPLELLRYLTRCGAAPLRAIVNGSWATIQADARKNDDMTFGEFPHRMQEQVDEIRKILSDLSAEDLAGKDVALPWGETMKMGAALVNTSLKFLTAYRMQLFLYAKQRGRPELMTMNCWLGQDPPV